MISFVFVVLFTNGAFAQCPTGGNYGVNAQEDILYAVDTGYDGRIDSLFLDIYTPAGDDNALRPMIIWIHGGGFFRGNKDSFRDICKGFAQAGYATATISYRLGFLSPDIGNASPPFSYDDNEPIRAGYRSMQDTKSAIRFLKARHMQDSTDIDHFFLAGASAGGIAAMTAANIVHSEDKYAACKQLDAVKIADTTYQRPDLGPVEGKSNINGYDSKVEGVISIFGGLINLDFLSSSYPKHYFLYHQTLDPIVPCETHNGYWLLPLVKDNYPTISGGCSISDYFDVHGTGDKVVMPFIVNGVEHGVHDMEALLDSIHVFLRTVLCSPVMSNRALSHALSLRVYPQPAGSEVNIDLPEGIVMESGSIFDLSGRKIDAISEMLIKKANNTLKIDVSDLAIGLYFIHLKDVENRTYVLKCRIAQ